MENLSIHIHQLGKSMLNETTTHFGQLLPSKQQKGNSVLIMTFNISHPESIPQQICQGVMLLQWKEVYGMKDTNSLVTSVTDLVSHKTVCLVGDNCLKSITTKFRCLKKWSETTFIHIDLVCV